MATPSAFVLLEFDDGRVVRFELGCLRVSCRPLVAN